MSLVSRLARSSDLVSGMAQRRGMRPETCIAQDWREMVLRCSTCRAQDACETLQAVKQTLEAAPDYCCNKDRFGA